MHFMLVYYLCMEGPTLLNEASLTQMMSAVLGIQKYIQHGAVLILECGCLLVRWLLLNAVPSAGSVWFDPPAGPDW